MKAISIQAAGQIDIVNLPEPQPGLQDVVIAVRYVGLCGSDLGMYRGTFPLATYPRILGHEVSGLVVAKGAQVPDSIQEGERTALDNSMIMLCSSMLTGHHDATKLPVVMLGSAGGKLKGGQNLDYLDNPNRQMCRLYLSMMDKMGVHLDSFGDATEPLAEV